MVRAPAPVSLRANGKQKVAFAVGVVRASGQHRRAIVLFVEFEKLRVYHEGAVSYVHGVFGPQG